VRGRSRVELDSCQKKFGCCEGCVYSWRRRWDFAKAKRLTERAIHASGHDVPVTIAQILDVSGKRLSPGVITIIVLSHYLLSWHQCVLHSNSLDDSCEPFSLVASPWFYCFRHLIAFPMDRHWSFCPSLFRNYIYQGCKAFGSCSTSI